MNGASTTIVAGSTAPQSKRASALACAVSHRAVSIEAETLADRMAAAHGAAPPLAEASDVGVVRRHRRTDPGDLEAGAADANAELRVLARDHALVEAAQALEDEDTHEHDPADHSEIAEIPLG